MTTNHELGPIESALRSARAEGRKVLLPYVTGGYPVGQWPTLIEGFASAGADAIEIGIPFSDPVMDGPTIQEASTIALEAGINPSSVIAEVAKVSVNIPLIAMTYYNICYNMGHERFASSLNEAGISGTILPDLPLEEFEPWSRVAQASGIEHVLLAPPTASDERLERIAEATQGFVYAVGLVGITGERAELAASSLEIARRLKDCTDKPVVVGVGVSTPDQAAEICEVADGVVVASAIIRRMLDGGSLDQAVAYVGEFRNALD